MENDNADNAVNNARLEAGLSVKALADMLDAPYSTMKDCCSGKHKPPRWVEKLILKEINNR